MLLDRLFSDPAQKIRRLRVAQRATAADNATFKAQDNYFQIGVAQVHIQKLQAFLKDYAPLVYAHVKYQLGSRSMETTYVMDPRNDNTGARGGGLQGYQPIVTPVPYRSDDILLTIGLLRLQVADHLPKTIGLLTSIAEVALPDFQMADKVAEVLRKGVDGLLSDPEAFVVGYTGRAGDGRPLSPGYVVLTRDHALQEGELFFDGGVLKVGDEAESATPYIGGDFIVFRVELVATRDDYLMVEPIATLYEKCLRAIAENQVATLTDAHADLRRAAVSASQFTLADAKRIVTALTNELKDRWETQKSETTPFKARDPGPAAPPLATVSEDDFIAASSWIPQPH